MRLHSSIVGIMWPMRGAGYKTNASSIITRFEMKMNNSRYLLYIYI